MNYDVVVVGGGTAGVIAAVQAGREGVKTLLVEKSEILGGSIVNAGVTVPGLFHAWKKQIISGIGWELICKCMDEEKRPYPDFSKQNNLKFMFFFFFTTAVFSLSSYSLSFFNLFCQKI